MVDLRPSILGLCFLLSLTFCFAAESCLQKFNLTAREVENVAPSTPLSEVPENIKCYSRCLISDYIGDDDKIDLKALGNRAKDEEKIILADCKQKFDDITDSCDYAYKILQCLYLGKTN